MNPFTNPMHPLNPLSPVYVGRAGEGPAAAAAQSASLPPEQGAAFVVVFSLFLLGGLAYLWWMDR